MSRSLGRAVLPAVAAFGLLLSASSALASVSGVVYENDPTSTDASVIPSSSLPTANFTASAINFNTGCSDCTTVANFLNNPVFTNQQNGFSPTSSADNIFLLITGKAFLNSGNNAFVVGHDDGVVLTFPLLNGGMPVVNAPGPTGYNATPFNVSNPGAAGLFDFTLQYAECCGGPANLDFTVNGLPPGVPEPASWLMLLLGLFGVGAVLRGRSQAAAEPV